MSARDAGSAGRARRSGSARTGSTAAGRRAGSSRVRSRAARRRPPRRWSPRRLPHPGRWLAALGAAVALAAGAVWLLYFSPVLGIREVAVSGEQTVSADLVREIAAITPRSPLARLDGAVVAGRVEGIPQVESVSIRRSWPSTVQIELVERGPQAVVQTDTGWWLVDRSGVLYAQVSEPPADVPPLEVESPGPQDRATLAAVTVLDTLPGELREKVRRLSAESPDSVVLHLASGRTVIWGAATDSEVKARVLSGLLGQKGRTFDVSSPSAVVIR